MKLDPARRSSDSHHAASGRLLLHPVAIAALVVLVVNDHALKAAFPGVLTGKVSDLAGLIVFPLLLVTIVEVARPRVDRPPLALASVAITVAGFIAVKATVTGAELYGWSLGISQWIATLGPLRAATPAPTAVVADPTDLVALPAVLVAFWIAHAHRSAPSLPRVQTRPSAAAVSMLVVAGLAAMATSKSAPTASADFEAELHLTRDAPVAVRHLDLTIAEGDDDIWSATFTASLWERMQEGTNEFGGSSKARLSLIADASDVEIPIAQGYFSPALNLTALCASGCDHGVTLVARLAPDAPDTADFVLSASVFVSADYREGEDQLMDTTLSLVEDVAARIDGTAPGILSIASGSIEVGSDDLERRQTINLAVDGSALDRPLAFPLVGRLSVSFVVESASGNPSATKFSVSTREAGDPIYLEADAVPIDIDWLGQCDVGVDCAVPVDITVIYEPWMNAPVADDPDANPEPTESEPGFVRLKWTVEARLEAFDGRLLPADALTLTTD